jgi:hypothetical protein
MEFNEEELKLEQKDAEATTIKLVSTSVKCEVCKSGTVVKVGRETPLVIYTRFGTKKAVHVEMRCNNRSLPCRAGHYYGFVRNGTSKVINGDVLKGDFLVTSNQTAFSIDYLWDMTLQILFSRATFEGLGNIFNNLHFTNLPYDIRVGPIWVQLIPIPIQIYSPSRYLCRYRYRYICTNISAIDTDTDIFIWPIFGR